MSDGANELRQLIDMAHEHDQQAGDGTFSEGQPERAHASEFREAVVGALRNLAGRVRELEIDLNEAQSHIRRLEGK